MADAEGSRGSRGSWWGRGLLSGRILFWSSRRLVEVLDIGYSVGKEWTAEGFMRGFYHLVLGL